MIVNLSGVDVVIWWEVPKLVGETSWTWSISWPNRDE
jgi:hypothetical protein